MFISVISNSERSRSRMIQDEARPGEGDHCRFGKEACRHRCADQLQAGQTLKVAQTTNRHKKDHAVCFQLCNILEQIKLILVM